MTIHIAMGSLAGLRALAAARGTPPLPPLPAPPAAALARPFRTSLTRAGAAANTAEVLGKPPTEHRDRREDKPVPTGGVEAASQSSLLRSVRWLLEAGRPQVATHLLQEEWALTNRGLEDKALSKQLILQLMSTVNTAAAMAALPLVAGSTELFKEAIQAAAERRSLKGVRTLLSHAIGARLSEGVGAADLWRAAIVAFGALGRPVEARRAFVGMRTAGAWEPSDTSTANLLLNALAGDVRVQFIRFNQLRQEGLSPEVSTYNTLLKACMRARDVQRAGLAVKWMEQDGVRPDEITFNTLVKVHSYAEDFDGVLRVWRQMADVGFAPTAKLWGSLLLACSAGGQLEQAAIYWWEMKQLQLQHNSRVAAAAAGAGAHAKQIPSKQGAESGAEGGKRGGKRGGKSGTTGKGSSGGAGYGGGVITTDNLCAMMIACNDAGQYERALTAFADAQAMGVPADTRAYNIALRACHTPGKTMRPEQLVQAFALYDTLKRSGLPPDAITFATLFSLCAAAHQGPCALQLYAEMQELGVQENVVALTALLKAVGSTPGPTMPQQLLRIFHRMCRGPARVKPNHGTYRTVIAALREGGALAEALRVYQSMRREHPADNSEFEGLTAVAAERALACEDAHLRQAVAEVCNITNAREVDLHGMSVLEARAAVLCVLALLQQAFRDTGRVDHDVTLITGRGKGSRGGEALIRKEVFALLERLHLALPPDQQAQAPDADVALASASTPGKTSSSSSSSSSGSTGGSNPGRIVIPQELVQLALISRQAHRKTISRQAHQAADGSGAQHGSGCSSSGLAECIDCSGTAGCAAGSASKASTPPAPQAV